MTGKRRERIARIIREEASRVVLYELADPRIGFVTVTKVKVSADLSHARVFVSVYGDEAARNETMKALSRAASVVQRACGPRLKTRTIPHVEFEFDPSIERAIHVSKLITEARATDPDGGVVVEGGDGNAGKEKGEASESAESAERDDGAEGAEEADRGEVNEGAGEGTAEKTVKETGGDEESGE